MKSGVSCDNTLVTKEIFEKKLVVGITLFVPALMTLIVGVAMYDQYIK